MVDIKKARQGPALPLSQSGFGFQENQANQAVQESPTSTKSSIALTKQLATTGMVIFVVIGKRQDQFQQENLSNRLA
ncbi:MAG: hypothetical protein CL862_04675 [Cyanobium sp. NAT70]|nr:hypothetical protein [Cyanobium sp. NAT70]